MRCKKKILYIISGIDRAQPFEWIADSSLAWEDAKISFVFLANCIPKTAVSLEARGFEVHIIRHYGKLSWPITYIKLLAILRKIRPSVVHCHQLEATLLGFTAALLFPGIFRLYTRHYSTLHHNYFRKGILWDRYVNLIADRVVAISSVVSEVLIEWEGVDPKKINLIHHGFDIRYFASIADDRVESFLKRNNLPGDKRLVGVVSRFVEWKGIQYILEAFLALRKSYTDVHLVLLNATGAFGEALSEKFDLLPSGSYTKIVFEEDMAAAYAAMTCFVHVPIDAHCEAFGQVYVEALASGVPSVFTLSGIATEIIEHEFNALVVPFENANSICTSLQRLLDNKEFADNLARNGFRTVNQRFLIDNMSRDLLSLYSELTG